MNTEQKTVIVFGGGCSGLSCAHFLSQRGFKVIVIETLDSPGGMARSDRLSNNNMPTEYSWRGEGSSYDNLYDIMREIPIGDSTVYDSQLSRPMKFHLLDDEGSEFGATQKADEHYYLPYSHRISPHDKIKLGILYLRAWFSCERRSHEVYSKQKMYDVMKANLSPIAAKTQAYLTGPFIGSGHNTCDWYTASHFYKRFFFPSAVHWLYDKEKDEYWCKKGRIGWSMILGPSSEVWFWPWVKHLKLKGVEFRFNHTLQHLGHCGTPANEITSATVIDEKGEMYTLKADYYVLAINPYAVKEILDRNLDLKASDSELQKFDDVTSFGEHLQISYRIFFSEKINIPHPLQGYILTDSEYNLCFFDQSAVFNKDVYLGDDIKTLWSGTATVDNVPGQLHNVDMKHCTKEQFIQEVLHQMYKCKSLDCLVRCANEGRSLKDFKPPQIECWYSWQFVSDADGIKEVKSETKTKKWVNHFGFKHAQPKVETSIPNLLLAGAHVQLKNSFDLYSMENACHSGRHCADIISGQKTCKLHTDPIFMKPFQCLDEVFYTLGLPDVIVVLWVIVLCILILVYIIYNRPNYLLFIILVMIGITILTIT